MLGGYISDLQTGDVFEPVEYELTAFMCSEYAHGVEENWEWFHSAAMPTGRQMRPPTMIHVDKMRIPEKNCARHESLPGVIADGRIMANWREDEHGMKLTNGDAKVAVRP